MSHERDCDFERVYGRQIRTTISEWRMQKAESVARERSAATNLRMNLESTDATERTGRLEVERFRVPLPCGIDSQGHDRVSCCTSRYLKQLLFQAGLRCRNLGISNDSCFFRIALRRFCHWRDRLGAKEGMVVRSHRNAAAHPSQRRFRERNDWRCS